MKKILVEKVAARKFRVIEFKWVEKAINNEAGWAVDNIVEGGKSVVKSWYPDADFENAVKVY